MSIMSGLVSGDFTCAQNSPVERDKCASMEERAWSKIDRAFSGQPFKCKNKSRKHEKDISRPPVPSHSTPPFENLRVLSPSAVSSGPNGIVEGLMALSEIEGLVAGSRCQRDHSAGQAKERKKRV